LKTQRGADAFARPAEQSSAASLNPRQTKQGPKQPRRQHHHGSYQGKSSADGDSPPGEKVITTATPPEKRQRQQCQRPANHEEKTPKQEGDHGRQLLLN
jgi:hypothetical protein